ncbi:MAG: pyridoxamine 5'-phosphate oxidase family protein [Alphaproteobacteria bacterium]
MLTADMKDLISGTMLCFAATVNEDGSPNLSPKSSLRVHDDTHLMFANMASPGTIANLRRDPRIELNCVDIFSRRGYRFSGRAELFSGGDPHYEALRADVAAEHGETLPVHDAVLIQVRAVSPVISPAYTFVDGVTEEILRNAYHGKYGVQPLAAS